MQVQEKVEFPVGWMLAINTESEPCPPFAICEAKGVDEATGLLKIGKPSADGQAAVFFNGGVQIPAYDADDLPGCQGQVHQTFPTRAAYETADDDTPPAHDEIWGTQEDSWYLHKDEFGFRIIGSGSSGICNVILALPTLDLSQTVVTDVTWDEETCEMTKTTKTLGELLMGAG